MDQSGRAGRGGGPGDVAGALDMDLVERPLQDADQVDHRVGPVHRGGDRGAVIDIGADRLELAERAQGLQVESPARITLGGADADAGLQQGLRHVAAEKAAGAEHSDEDIRLGRHGAPLPPRRRVDKA